jgi:hypothetical protein
MKDPEKPYDVYVDDNYHYMDESGRRFDGAFADCAAAIARCKDIVEVFLREGYRDHMTEDELWEGYRGYGEDPWISSTDPACTFSARDYAKARCAEIAGTKRRSG